MFNAWVVGWVSPILPLEGHSPTLIKYMAKQGLQNYLKGEKAVFGALGTEFDSYSIEQGFSALALDVHFPAVFNSSLDQTHLPVAF